MFIGGPPGLSVTPFVQINLSSHNTGDLTPSGQFFVLSSGTGSIQFSPIIIPGGTNPSTVTGFGEVMASLQPCAHFSGHCLDPVPLPPVSVDFPVVGRFQFEGVGGPPPFDFNVFKEVDLTLAPEPKSLDCLQVGLLIAAVRAKRNHSRS